MDLDTKNLDPVGVTLRDLLKGSDDIKVLAQTAAGSSNVKMARIVASLNTRSHLAAFGKLKALQTQQTEWAKFAVMANASVKLDMSKFVRFSGISPIPPGWAELIASKSLFASPVKTRAMAAALTRDWGLTPVPVLQPAPPLASPVVAAPAPGVSHTSRPSSTRPVPNPTATVIRIVSLAADLLMFATFLEDPDLRHWLCLVGVVMIAAAAEIVEQNT